MKTVDELKRETEKEEHEYITIEQKYEKIIARLVQRTVELMRN